MHKNAKKLIEAGANIDFVCSTLGVDKEEVMKNYYGCTYECISWSGRW